MTDLCYNCLNCHLPEPCKHDLVRCEICYAWGHQFLFCPRGVHLRLPDYAFFALCQNCDVWHLPEPCSKVFHICTQCTNPGHLEHFCPVNSTQKVVNSGTRTTGGEVKDAAPPPARHFVVDSVGLMAHDTITRIKLDAVNQAFSMLGQGYLPFQIIEFMGGPYRPGQTPNPEVANARMAAIGQRHLAATLQLSRQVSLPTLQSSSFIQPTVEKTNGPERHMSTDSSKWRRIEPRPSFPDELKVEDVLGTYARMQQRFDHGDLARAAEQQHPLYMMSREGAPSAMRTNPLLQKAIPRVQTTGAQPAAQFLSQQATQRIGSVASQAQVADLDMTAGASPMEQDMSQLQRPTPNMQGIASPLQSSTMAMKRPSDGDDADNANGAGTGKAQKTGKKKLKLSTRTGVEGSPADTTNQGPRCAKCIKSHKRCVHRTQSPATNLPLGSSPVNTPSTPSNHVPSSGVPEDSATTPMAMPDHSDQPLTLSAMSTEVPVQAVAKKTDSNRKR